MADLPSQDHLEGLGKIDQFEFSYPGDYILLYEDPPEAPEAEDVKEEISAAYDKVAHTASIEGEDFTLMLRTAHCNNTQETWSWLGR